ncbi:hypothetical protein [Cellulomonas pakistanensis]|uniref:Peptidase S26 domain-containing protein n=1 Tax=Cellulomonas pakistanensis TaxID=992287 RepID=A0A919U3U4_9CELL|nr:hypothetical protein [Cellulomonas pakistanensis]GIG37628.1 hypothetical protein Cpa01nite_30090 [Cellulomonas pakistanensis]
MPGAHAARPGPGRARERATDLGREVLLTLAALFGAVCVLVVVLVATMDLGVIVFRTGSMSPTIPTGGAAVVRTVPADQVEVGDVVTVPSPVGPLPVTHRVVHAEPLGDGSTRLRLRGDANDSEDPFPYDVTEVRRVVASAPGVGFALERLRDPWALGAVSVGLSLLVSWALWPRERRRRGQAGRAPRGSAGHAPGPAGSAGVTRAAGLLVVVAAAGALGLGSAAPAGAAAAPVPAPSPTAPPTAPPPGGFVPGGSGGQVLQLASSLPLGSPWDLSPGSDLAWRVESTVRPPGGAAAAAGTLWVSLLAGGPLVERGGVALVVQLCDTGWAADGVTCPGGAREVPATVDGTGAHVDRAEVGPVTSDGTQAVVVRLRVPADLGDEYQGLEMTLALRFDAFGEEVYLSDVLAAVDDEPGYTSQVLGVTGADLRPALWGTAAVLAGASLAGWARRHRHRERWTEVRDAP